MNDETKIEPGDEVNMVLCDGNHIIGIVLGLPCATGDSWRIRAKLRDKQFTYYVQTFWHMRLTKKAPRADERSE